jgi:hypothetical protein
MADFVGYGDESGKQDDAQSPCSAYGILVSPDKCWGAFNEAWNKALHKAEVDYFHYREFGKREKPYRHLDEDIERQLFVDLIDAIRDADLEAYATAARHSALVQFKERTGLFLDSDALGLYTCLGYIRFDHEQRNDITLHLDWVENKARKLANAKDYIATDPDIPDFGIWFDSLKIDIVPRSTPGAQFSKAPGYQAADFLAWEIRKYVHLSPEDERQRTEFDGLIRPMDWPPARRRKSLHALNAARGIRGTFWDVEVLENEHEARGGVWKTL